LAGSEPAIMIAASRSQSFPKIVFGKHGPIQGDTAGPCVTTANIAILRSDHRPSAAQKNRVGKLPHRAGSRRFEQMMAAEDYPAAPKIPS